MKVCQRIKSALEVEAEVLETLMAACLPYITKVIVQQTLEKHDGTVTCCHLA